ncbi:TonB-dependent receptor [Oleiagrimonas sp. C23AA]|uniref:TonB-dependent receptor plug domain-containing protein n=1 Tax=Oleiagrimonas sp. C23AA TaxID=2719047 RepID=UPI00141F8012|nr:TonB-dependent receptor [Oleiagrimonas sp. C23AA]NII09648.1 TonB-dependent receptor [Oleiagrimonas sp. C23AA]
MKSRLLCLAIAACLAAPASAAWAAHTGSASMQSTQDDSSSQSSDTTTSGNKRKKSSDDQSSSQPQKMKAVQVTGSLIPRAEIEGPSPTTTITANDIEKQGFGDVFSALRAQPIANGSVQDPQFTGGFTPGAETVSLFGLSPSFTLTLLDGKPMASYPLAYNGSSNITDIANIPVGLIDHIDILTGGQSSIYGSAAIAGVVNIVLKDHIEGTHMGLRLGSYSDGGGDNQRFQFSSGTSIGKLDISGGIQVSHQSPIWAYQRSYIDSYDDDPTGNGGVPSRVYLRMYYDANGSPHYIDPGASACQPLSNEYFGSVHYSYRPGLGYYCGSTKNAGLASLSNESKDANGSLFLKYHINDHTQLYSTILYSYSDPTYAGGSPFWNNTFLNQNTGQYELWQRIWSPEEVGADATQQHVFTHSYNFSAGVKGQIGESDWSYDAYYNRSSSKVIRKTHDQVANNGVDQYYLGPQLGTDANGYPIYAPNLDRLYTPITPQIYDSFVALNRAASVSWTQNETITANTTDLFELPAGSVGFAAILQAGNEHMSNRSTSALADTGFFRGQGGSTVASGSRKQYAAGMEMQVPIFSTLMADLSGRYDKYSYGGHSTAKSTYKIGLEYRPIDTLLLRGSYATAFRAPDMFYLFSNRSSGYSTSTDYYKCRAAGYTSENFDSCPQAGTGILGISSGNLRLKPITAKSFTYGFVWSTSDNSLSWSVDYNAIHISNEVATLGNNEILQLEANCRLGTSENGQTAYDINSPTCQEVLGEVTRLPDSDPVNPGGIQSVSTYPINVSSEYQTGIQSELTYRLNAGRYGQFVFSGNYYDALKHTYREKEGDPTYNLLCCANSDEFKSRVTGNVTWAIGKWSTTVYGIRDGHTWNQAGTAKNIGPWILYNASVHYQVNPKARISLIVNNIANKRPPVDVTNGGWPYYDTGDYNALGRAVWMELGYDFGT